MPTLENRANQGIKKNDIVRVISGREGQSGKTGKVLRVITSQNRVLIEKVNMVKRHQKPNQQQRQGGIVEKEAAIHLSNVVLVSRGVAPAVEKEKKAPAKRKKKES
jgi:large subunit ribosomal protein L24